MRPALAPSVLSYMAGVIVSQAAGVPWHSLLDLESLTARLSVEVTVGDPDDPAIAVYLALHPPSAQPRALHALRHLSRELGTTPPSPDILDDWHISLRDQLIRYGEWSTLSPPVTPQRQLLDEQ